MILKHDNNVPKIQWIEMLKKLSLNEEVNIPYETEEKSKAYKIRAISAARTIEYSDKYPAERFEIVIRFISKVIRITRIE